MKKQVTKKMIILIVLVATLLLVWFCYTVIMAPWGTPPYADRTIIFANKPDCISAGVETFINKVDFYNGCQKNFIIDDIQSDSKLSHYEVYIHNSEIPDPGILVDLSKDYPECLPLETPLKNEYGMIAYKCNSITMKRGDWIGITGLNKNFKISGSDGLVIEGKLS